MPPKQSRKPSSKPAPRKPDARQQRNAKTDSLEQFRSAPEGATLTTDQGVRIPQTDDSLKAGERGPTLLEDFHLREKLTRFDHERIPERVVHARGAAAHGFFQVYEPLGQYTKAGFLNDPSLRTPVFVRFSTVAGSRGSADTVRDVRGFATKFYTAEGNFDLVGNNMPVFFIQDGIKFPDFIHAVKPEPQNEMPQAASAHDTFWDFVSLTPETAHMILWVMSDRALPRSYSLMEGFGVHTFRFVNEKGRAVLVKFHWKPLKGMASLVWDEAVKLQGADADFNRRDLWESIERGDCPEYELGVQIVEEKDELAYGFDLLDATKLLPEELVPVRRIGKMTLNRNPDNYFAETEQVAFCVSNVVPGIDFTNDPLLQARIFSYLDTQLTRLGGPNFAQIPINRPVAPVHNHQQDGIHQQAIPTSVAMYHPNTVGGGCPFLAGKSDGYAHRTVRVEGSVIRNRSPSFADHFGQAALFFHSMSAVEQEHIVEALQFELGKVTRKEIRVRVLEEVLANVDAGLAGRVAAGLGLPAPRKRPAPARGKVETSPALSLESAPKVSIRGRVVAILAADGCDAAEVAQVKAGLAKGGALAHVIARKLGSVKGRSGSLEVDKSLLTVKSVLYDAVYVAGGAALATDGDALQFIEEAFKHGKAIGAAGAGGVVLSAARIDQRADGVVQAPQADSKLTRAFVRALAQHRHWTRGDPHSVPA